MTIPWLIGQGFEPLEPRVLLFTLTGNLLIASLLFAVFIRRAGHPPQQEAA